MNGVERNLRSGWDGYVVGLFVFLFHLGHLPAFARSAMYHRDNLAFDFDVTRFVSLWGGAFDIRQNAAYYAVRHPLAIAPRLIARPLAESGIEPTIAAGAIAAACAGLSTVLAFRIALALGLYRPLAHLLTVTWAVSTTSLLMGVLPEAYGLALVALSWQILIALRWAQGHEPTPVLRVAAAVVSLGITVTNVALSGLVELAGRLARQPILRATAGTAGFAAVVAAISLTLAAVSFHIWPVEQIGTSGRAAKQLYWSATSAKADDKQSPVAVAWTFGAIAFVAPAVARYPSGDRINPYLYDLRGRDYDLVGGIAVLGWLLLLCLGVIAAARDRPLRRFWIVAGAWAAGNVALHSYWQFRETVFLYAAHAHIAIFVFVLAGARWAQTRRGGALAYAAVALTATLFMASNNLVIYTGLSYRQ